MTDAERIILVDEHDNPVGMEEKLRAHQDGGRLHRAFSVFIFNSRGQLLLQRRAADKYHFAGLWTNACCSHPRVGEQLADSAHQRLAREMGFDAPLEEAFSFIYKATDPRSTLTEHEFDHVFTGVYDGDPHPDPAEVDAWRWVDPPELERELCESRDRFTPWFPIAYKKLVAVRATPTDPRPTD